jgi:HTH-type transcriptional regulator/antitoxin HigA
VNAEALHAWQTHVLERSQSQNIRTFALKGLTPTWFSELVSLSTKPNALSLAESKLLQTGIHFIIEPHLPKTYLDGAAFLAPCGNPVVGMTMRYKRVDNFWFTLIHELGHVLLHCRKPNDVFFDDHESKSHSQKEHEADSFALNTLIPAGKWCPENLTTAKSVRDFAAKLQIHPDIVAGRLRSEQKNYKLFGPAFRETIINYPA